LSIKGKKGKMRIDELNLTGLEDLSGLSDHVYTQRAILGERLKFVRLVLLISFLAFLSGNPKRKQRTKGAKETKQEGSRNEGSLDGRGDVVGLWVIVANPRSPIAGKE
jgi:hypothetical protein